MVLIGLLALSLEACAVADWARSQHLFARSAPGLSTAQNGAFEARRVNASLRSQVAPGFTGCLVETSECFVAGHYVEARVRFEPQTGRFWFLDPNSGNTYFENGDLRTGNAFVPLQPQGSS